MTLIITQPLIDSGKKADCQYCPIALAYLAASGEYCSIFASSGIIARYFIRTRLQTIRLPRVAEEFIGKFDRGKPVQPFEFELDDLVSK